MLHTRKDYSVNVKRLDEIEKKLYDLAKGKVCLAYEDLNYKKIPCIIIEAKDGNEKEFNEIYQALLKNSKYVKLRRTPSGGVSICLSERFNFWRYDVRQLNAVVEITIVTINFSIRVQWRLKHYEDPFMEKEAKDTESGMRYFLNTWLPKCKKYGINMSDYAVDKETGLKAKAEIHTPDIKMYNVLASYQQPLAGINHLDFHKFYISGLIDSHPEFKPVVEELNELAKFNKKHKTGMASMIGLFHSKYVNYKYAVLARDAINNAYSRFDEVKSLLANRVIATNTDGIWYKGEVFHGKYEGEGLTQWSNDHTDCIIRFKSAGSYEYIENDKYTPVVRGLTRLDKTLKRKDWKWGDVFLDIATPIKWTFTEGEGIRWLEA